MERGWSGGTADALFAVSGEWKSLVDSVSSSSLMSVSAEAKCWMQVNQMAGNLTDQVRSIAKATVSLCILPSPPRSQLTCLPSDRCRSWRPQSEGHDRGERRSSTARQHNQLNGRPRTSYSRRARELVLTEVSCSSQRLLRKWFVLAQLRSWGRRLTRVFQTRVAHEVGTKGNLGVTAKVDDIEGTWQEITCVPPVFLAVRTAC